MRAGQLFIVTSTVYLRGFDYRVDPEAAGTRGAAIMMTACVDSKRAAKQAFARVGRYNEDHCARLVLDTIALSAVDDTERARLAAQALTSVSHSTQVRKQGSMGRRGKANQVDPNQRTIMQSLLLSVKENKTATK